MKSDPLCTHATRKEGDVVRLMRILGRSHTLGRLVMSSAAWRLSGLSYQTAVLATTGTLQSKREYMRGMYVRAQKLAPFLPEKARVLDFGTGLGGNILACSRHIEWGVGIDINPFYIRHAKRLAQLNQCNNVTFRVYDGVTLPAIPGLNCTICIGVFERLLPAQVKHYLSQMCRILGSGSTLIVYFLTEEAKANGFGARLGQTNYVFWSEMALSGLFDDLKLSLLSRVARFPNAGDTFVLRVT